jgi:D-aspartate ligase
MRGGAICRMVLARHTRMASKFSFYLLSRLTLKSAARGPSGVLLASAASGGTIASVRAFDRIGIDVHILSSRRLSAAAWSRHATRAYSAPAEIDTGKFLERLIEIGAANPGLVLLPTSDETAWMFSINARRLSPHFRLYSPPAETIRRVLDKKLLADAVASAGHYPLPTWDPMNYDELRALSKTLAFPILIKPRTHVQRVRNDKGSLVETSADLINGYQAFLLREQLGGHHDGFANHRPVLQPFAIEGSERVQSVTGFIDRTGELFVTRRSVKVFQRSQPIGVGICHESLQPSPALSKAAYDLCRELRYFGLFEIEFVRFKKRWAVIDFNPRLYHQIGLDIGRGMPLPLLAFLDATGQTDALRYALAKARIERTQKFVFCDRFTLRAILIAQALFGRVPRHERVQWQRWLSRHSASVIDVASDRLDPMPMYVHALSEISLGLKALPRFLLAKSTKSFGEDVEVEKVAS